MNKDIKEIFTLIKKYETITIFGHTNPELNKGWVYKTFIENPMPNYRLISAPTHQNIYLPEGFCARCGQARHVRERQEGCGCDNLI